MALIERFHVVAAERPVASAQTILEGMFVSLNTSGEVIVVASSTPSASTLMFYGIAGDTKNSSGGYAAMPGVQDVVIGANGSAGSMQNRVSDGFDETKASGKMTVYHTGGEFATDMFLDDVASLSPMAPLYVDISATPANNGKLTTATTNSNIVAYLLQAASSYPSGVPGVDATKLDGVAINGDRALAGRSMTAGTGNTFIEIKLNI